MQKKYKNRYRIESNRLQGWNYAANGLYFITICTQNMECVFGMIENKKMVLSEFGKIANNEWYKSFEIRDELISDEFILMPNHLHAIIIINKKHIDIQNNDNSCEIDGRTADDGRIVQTHGRSIVETHGRASLRIYRQPKSISSFVAGYKSGTINKIDDYIDLHNLKIKKYNKQNLLWQHNYNDHIIRNNTEYWRIKNYIKNNPAKWDNDKFNNG